MLGCLSIGHLDRSELALDAEIPPDALDGEANQQQHPYASGLLGTQWPASGSAQAA